MKFEAENFLSKGGKEYSRSLQLASISAASIYNPREMLPKSYILHPKNLSSEEGNRKVESGPLIDINYKFESLAEIENVGSFASVTVVSTIDDCKEDSFNGSLKGGVDSLHRFLNSDDKTADSNDFSDTEFVDANPGDECWNDAKIPVRKMTAAPRKRNLTHQFSSPALKNADSYELISNKVLSPMSTSNVSIGSAAWSAMLSVFSPARTQELGALSGKASGTFSFEKLHSSFNNVEKIDLIKQEASTIVTHTSLDKPVVENRNLYGSRSLMSRL